MRLLTEIDASGTVVRVQALAVGVVVREARRGGNLQSQAVWQADRTVEWSERAWFAETMVEAHG